jgi:tetratricopeptide (TPR) repeat protein
MDDSGSLARAEALVELRRYAEAESVLGHVLAAGPDDDRAWCVLALVHDGLGHAARMLEAANRAVALAPDHELGHRLASIALARLEQPEEAVRAAAEAVRLDPHGWRTHLQYSLVAAQVPRLAQDAYRAPGGPPGSRRTARTHTSPSASPATRAAATRRSRSTTRRRSGSTPSTSTP